MLAANNTVSWTKKHSLMSKWNILFEKSPEWIAFKPQLGIKVYPCYSCKNMFSSKLTFQDHINRRVIIIKYKCSNCTNTFTFYNRCSFLLHARKHFNLGEGVINLANVDISILPVELAGFARHESVPFLFDEEEEYSDNNAYINCQFYSPDDNDAGKQMITLRPFNLVFHYSEGGNNILLVLKQITTNVPLCEFITQSYDKQGKSSDGETSSSVNEPEPEIKREFDIEEFTIPVISKIESLNNDGVKKNSCPECMNVQDVPMATHFLGNNRPLDINLCCYVCKYVAPTKCSLKAHVRTHESASPYVCPECGKVFKNYSILHNHMDDVCFHLCKTVRFRCPAVKCGKLFVLPNTYASHFNNHLQSIHKCSACSVTFLTEDDFNEHSKMHKSSTSIKEFNCMVCKNLPTLTEKQCAEHVNWHLQDRERSVYIFTCKCCRSYFRSTATYSVHKQRCSKGEKVYPIILTSNCVRCGQKIVFREKDNYRTCTTCKQVNHVPPNLKNENEKKVTCMLCKEELTNEGKALHSRLCKYNNPIVTIQALSNESKDSDDTNSNDKFNTSNSDIDSKPSMDTSNDSIKSEESVKKKRKRSGNFNIKNKKVVCEEIDLQAENPVTFDGTYYCKLCDYKNTERDDFHQHIIGHRDVSTSYQCMECGECFVVKPSLIKHITHYHKITDITAYFMKNDCYDKFAIEELENSQKLVPGEHKGPVNENQCTVCLEQFEDSPSLNKHFRMHGMAFLMKKSSSL